MIQKYEWGYYLKKGVTPLSNGFIYKNETGAYFFKPLDGSALVATVFIHIKSL